MKINWINNCPLPSANTGGKGGLDKKDNDASLSLCISAASDEVTVRIIDNKSKEIIKEIPSQELREIREKIYDMAGRLFDKRV